MESVNCPSCGEENPARFRLCGFCGTPLASAGGAAAPAGPAIPADTSNGGTPPGSRAAPGPLGPPGSSGGSGTSAVAAPPLAPPTPAPAPVTPAPPVQLPPHEVRKTVTIVFSDLKGSTALGERLDPEALHEVKDRYFTSMAGEITRHGG